uniref:Uncharacterized protein n=1 Tax=Chromera velia CCMP2878 TaxID=1169474 RepID=A0A0G4HWL0_9ALVE|eukprot:Cvel_9065.t1-p1 / transcript=Cvel_9065.t1 / gene=Cvel_9065 / organism=Chromera_velia_CCMP2878 / gene_product=hypothetical protein / transcript_product=hypothetical protein / location=Cvel_scaffold514:28307-35689(-) / protein_length=173 / sequence_SO=supercontig / SO=protein_coding / is_pseudo=false
MNVRKRTDGQCGGSVEDLAGNVRGSIEDAVRRVRTTGRFEMPADNSQVPAAAGASLYPPKPHDFNWVNELNSIEGFDLWRREFLKFVKFQLKAKFILDDDEKKELWILALLRAFKKFDDLKDSTLTIKEQEQKFGENLFAAVAATILDPKESKRRQFEERYIAMKRERGDDFF